MYRENNVRIMKTSSMYENMFIISKIISGGESNFMQNKSNTWMQYRNVLSRYKNANMGSSTVHLRGIRVQMICTHTLLHFCSYYIYNIYIYLYILDPEWLHRQGGCLACCGCTFDSR